MNKLKVIRDMKESERKGDFYNHVVPVNKFFIKKVGDNYSYLPRNILRKAYEKAVRGCVFPITKITSKISRLKIIGRENLEGINSAVITSNHISRIDNMHIRNAVKGHKLYVTVAEFNNKKFLLGKVLRGAGILPFSSKSINNVKLLRAVSQLLKQDNYVLFYPEVSLWWHYEKPRPMKDGAFFSAVKNNVPVVPMFFTFEKRKGQYSCGVEKQNMVLNILKPIYPDENLSNSENIKYLRNKNYQSYKQKYEEFYNRKLVYETETDNEEIKKMMI